jgi:hypothetical protein
MRTISSKKKNKIQKNIDSQVRLVSGQPVKIANLTISLDKLLLEVEDSDYSPQEFSFNDQEIDNMIALSLLNLNIKGVRIFGKKKRVKFLLPNFLKEVLGLL